MVAALILVDKDAAREIMGRIGSGVFLLIPGTIILGGWGQVLILFEAFYFPSALLILASVRPWS